MHMTPVNSSNISAVGYDPSNRILCVSFHTGSTYAYYDVPQEIYIGLMNASSVGRYHKEHVKRSFRYQQIC